MKIKKALLLGAISFTFGAAAIGTSININASASTIPAGFRHHWSTSKWGQTYKINCYKYHCNFFDGSWHRLYYSHIGHNKYAANPSGHSYNGLIIKGYSAHHIRVLYDIAYLNFYR